MGRIWLLLLVVPVLAWPADELPWRVVSDRDAGLTLRLPGGVVMPDLGRADFLRPGGNLEIVRTEAGGTACRWRVDRDGRAVPDVRVVSVSGGLDELDAVVRGRIGWICAWAPEDYHRADPSRPFALRSWALDGIEARLGTAPEGVVLALAQGARLRLVALRRIHGHEAEDRTILDGVELIGRRGITWREAQTEAGRVQAAVGGGWPWEVDTPWIHLAGEGDPATGLRLARRLESLCRAYEDLFRPTALPPVKAEVRLLATAASYQQAYRRWADPGLVVVGPAGIHGGAFDPGSLALWLYEESGALGGPAMAVERVAAHECTHLFVHLAGRGRARVPVWLNEGLAVLFEGGVLRDGRFQLRAPRERLEGLRTWYRDQRRMIHPVAWYLDHEGGLDASAYAEVYAMVHSLVFAQCGPACATGRGGHRDCGRTRFWAWWKAMMGGEPGAEAFERQIVADLARRHGGREGGLAAWEAAVMAGVMTGKAWEIPTE